MKTRLLLAFAFAAGAAACSDPAPDAFTFRGEIAGMDGEKIYLMYDGSGGGKKVLDSAVVKRGRFAFEGKIAPVSYSFLMKTRDLERANQEEMSVLWLEPGKMAYACPTGDLQEFTLTGSRTQDSCERIPAWILRFPPSCHRSSISLPGCGAPPPGRSRQLFRYISIVFSSAQAARIILASIIRSSMYWEYTQNTSSSESK